MQNNYNVPPFCKPKTFSYNFNKKEEIKAIRELQNKDVPQGISTPKNKQLLIGSWNIANFDVQKRTNSCHHLITEIIKPFDLMAIQEVNANMKSLKKIMKKFIRKITEIQMN